MERKLIDMLGQRFGRWTVVARAPNSGTAAAWLCECDCGARGVVKGQALRAGRSKSCGCYDRETSSVRAKSHGQHGTSTYRIWGQMVQRCTNPKAGNYSYYGARGISVCDRWRESFASFYADMGERPAGLTLDRIDVNGNYEPGNCRWVTWREQHLNKRKPEVQNSVR